MMGEADVAKNEVHLLKVHANKVSDELQKSAETYSLLIEEKKKLTADLQEEQCKTLALESKLWGMELQCIWD
ncbi:hypothetical protein U1Q18_015189 [Sarracenia purpurea var. burkii]